MDYAKQLGFLEDTPTYRVLELFKRWHVDVLDMVMSRGMDREEVTDYDPSMPLGDKMSQLIRVKSQEGRWEYMSLVPGRFDTVEIGLCGTESCESSEKVAEDWSYRYLNGGMIK